MSEDALVPSFCWLFARGARWEINFLSKEETFSLSGEDSSTLTKLFWLVI